VAMSMTPSTISEATQVSSSAQPERTGTPSSSTTVTPSTSQLGQMTTITNTKGATTSQSKATSATTTSKPGQQTQTSNQAGSGGSGGGSPFDISSRGSRIEGGSTFAFLIFFVTVLLGTVAPNTS
jgi:hypothetical protein